MVDIASVPVPQNLLPLRDLLVDRLKRSGGVLRGQDLYRELGEQPKDDLKRVILALKNAKAVNVEGDLETPFGVFQSVIVKL